MSWATGSPRSPGLPMSWATKACPRSRSTDPSQILHQSRIHKRRKHRNSGLRNARTTHHPLHRPKVFSCQGKQLRLSARVTWGALIGYSPRTNCRLRFRMQLSEGTRSQRTKVQGRRHPRDRPDAGDVGAYLCPVVNLDSLQDVLNVRIITCAGQATPPIVAAIFSVVPG